MVINDLWFRTRSRPSGHNGAKGFTLIEAMVCLAILSMVFAVVFQSFSGSLRAVRIGEEYSRATIMAQAKLAGLLAAPELEEATLTGDFPRRGQDMDTDVESYRWRTEVSRYESDGIGGLDDALLPLFMVTVEVSWQSGRERRSIELAPEN